MEMLKEKDTIRQTEGLTAKSSELYVGSNSAKEFCISYSYEPTNVEESQIGNLYIVGEVKLKSKNCAYLANTLASIIKKELFKNPKREALESFEASLNKANAYLADIASQGNIDWIGRLNMVCALQSANKLHISQAGNARMLLLRNNFLVTLTENLDQEESPFPSKTFTNIVSGPVNAGDKIIEATPGLFNILSLEELKHAISGVSCARAIENLGEIFEMDGDTQDSSSIIIDILSDDVSENIFSPQENTIARQNIASKLSLKDILGAVPDEVITTNTINSAILSQSREESALKIRKLFSIAPILDSLKYQTAKVSLAMAKSSARLIKKIITKIKSSSKKHDSDFSQNLEKLAAIHIVKIEENIASSETARPVIINRATNKNKKTKHRVMNYFVIKYAIKIISIVFIVSAILAGAYGIFSVSKRYYQDKTLIAEISTPIINQEIMLKIQQKQEEAETALIYKDETKAMVLLTEAIVLLEQTPDNSISQITRGRIQTQIDQLNKITTIQNPFMIVDLDAFSQNTANAKILLKNGNSLFAIDMDNGQIIKIDLIKYQAEKYINIPLQNGEKIIVASSFNDNIALITSFSTVFEVNATAKIIDKEYLLSGLNPSNIVDSKMYNGNLYVLSSADNQVFKITNGNPSPWIKMTMDITGANSLAIDGRIYILNADGQISTLSAGKLMNTFALPSSSLKNISTNESGNLFFTSPDENKIIMSSKNGEMIAQYKSEAFNDLKDICVNGDNNIYILSNNKIYRIDS